MKNQECVSITLDEGTVLEAGGLDPFHPGEKPSGFFIGERKRGEAHESSRRCHSRPQINPANRQTP